MSKHEPPKKGDEVLIESPHSIRAEVLRAADPNVSADDAYCVVRVVPEKQYYRPAELEPVRTPEPERGSKLRLVSLEWVDELGHANEIAGRCWRLDGYRCQSSQTRRDKCENC